MLVDGIIILICSDNVAEGIFGVCAIAFALVWAWGDKGGAE